jgi:AraC-like DNA-binding protein
MTTSPHFKPETCAVVLIDHQVGTMQLIRNITSDASVRNAVILGKTALAFGMPIVMTSSMEGHIQGDISVSDLSHAAGIPITDVNAGLRAATGLSPWQFVLLRRVERAKNLLTTSRRAMSEIAFECGFSSSQHFATAFKKQVGTTPSAYRRERMP